MNPHNSLPPPQGTKTSNRRSTRLLLIGTVALALTGATSVAFSAQAAVPDTASGWTRVWVDDFIGQAGTAPSSANWLYDLGHSYPGGAWNWGTGEIEEMTNSTNNVYLDGSGNLAIKPIRDSAGNWTSGRIETQRTDFAAPVGGKVKVEGRLQQPNVTGAEAAGYWPAFWTLGDASRPVSATNWPSVGEWDIMENVNGMPAHFGTLHCGTVSGGPCNETVGIGSGKLDCPTCLSDFHTYAVELDRSVSPEQMRWYLDGKLYHTVTATQVDAATWNNATHRGIFVILNVAMGGAFPGAFGAGLPTDTTKSGVPMLVDYVAVYTAGGGPGPTPTDDPTTQPPTSQPPTSQPPTSQPPTSTAPPSGDTRNAYSTIQAESYDAQSGTATETCSDTGTGSNVGGVANGDWIQFNKVDFGSTPATQFYGRVASGAAGGISGLIEVRLDSRNAAPIGSFAVANTGGWQSWRTVPANITGVTGTHTVYITFTSGQPSDFANLNWISFGH